MVLYEDQVVGAVVRHLRDKGWTIDSVALAVQTGDDIVASREGVRLVVEAKGEGSSKAHTARYGMPFNRGQVATHVAVAVLRALRVTSEGVRDRGVLGDTRRDSARAKRTSPIMTILPGPPYVQEPRVKVKSPGWHRLPSTAWILVDVILTAATAILLGIDGAFLALLGVGLVAFLAAVVTFVSATMEISRHRNPVASVINLILSLLVNPYMIAGYLVWFRALDFG